MFVNDSLIQQNLVLLICLIELLMSDVNKRVLEEKIREEMQKMVRKGQIQLSNLSKQFINDPIEALEK